LVLVPGQHKVIHTAHSADNLATNGILAQASGKVIMKRTATLLLPTIAMAFCTAPVTASTPKPQRTQATAPAAASEKLNTASPNTIYNFAVRDAAGVLLTCAKQQIDSDTFSGCTLAPGRTLDDLMTSIVRTIRAVENKVDSDPK
jgi:hypothetical protein